LADEDVRVLRAPREVQILAELAERAAEKRIERCRLVARTDGQTRVQLRRQLGNASGPAALLLRRGSAAAPEQGLRRRDLIQQCRQLVGRAGGGQVGRQLQLLLRPGRVSRLEQLDAVGALDHRLLLGRAAVRAGEQQGGRGGGVYGGTLRIAEPPT